ncbi:MAG: glycosyl hydrolase [Planctomycetia bacterium]|nr:glycosyl hydrolase [Planctomycetia bacterium]
MNFKLLKNFFMFLLLLFCILCKEAFTQNSPKYPLSDPENQMPAPDYAIGFGSRDPNKDYYPEFKSPPPGYGNVPFFWWMGDKLTKERLRWQLEQFRGMKLSGLQVNYAHSDKGGKLWGYTFPSDPPLFSDAWWELHSWFMQEAKKQGIAVSLSDYTLGISQGWKWDEAIRDYPEIIGGNITIHSRNRISEDTLKDGEFLLSDPKDLKADYISVAAIGDKIYTVRYKQKNPSLDPMHPKSGAAVIEKFFQPFLDKNVGEGGKGLNFFFSDELDFQVKGLLWNAYFAEEFQKMKGYDIRPVLAALFTNIGDKTVKIRLDYYDVLVELSERNYFKPIYEWHQKHGMIYGCDHGGRGLDVGEFGDYFRTQRWNHGPGSDQPVLGRNLVKAKVSASQAHLYQHPRVWLEGFHSSGWGTSLEQLTDATFANYVMGYNLISLHGLYYSTKGGWWEWAPPCNHWRNPYWKHQKIYMEATERLAYLLTQGTHVADVAVLYPVAPCQANIESRSSVNTAFNACRTFYNSGIDLDFIDFQSVDRAVIKDKKLHVSGESYRVLVLPHMKVIRHSTLQKAVKFVRAGGIVVTLGALPEFSDRLGANDPEVKKLVTELPKEWHFTDINQAVTKVKNAFTADFQLKNGNASYFVHRKIGKRDVYVFFQMSANAEITFRSHGKAELWDIWNGDKTLLMSVEMEDKTSSGEKLSRIQLKNDPADLVIVAFTQDEKNILPADISSENIQEKHIPRTFSMEMDNWECRYIPTLDNTWGDFRWPVTKNTSISPKIGPEARQFKFHFKETAGSTPEKYTYEFGPKFRQLGPLSIPAQDNHADVLNLEKELAKIKDFPTSSKFRGHKIPWKNYNFSWRWAVEGDPGHQGYHGLKENMYDTFIRLGKFQQKGHLQTIRLPEITPKSGEVATYYLWSTVTTEKNQDGIILTHGTKPAKIWLNGNLLKNTDIRIPLKAGVNSVLLRYNGPTIGYFLIVSPDSEFAHEAQLTQDPAVFAPHAQWIWTENNENEVFFRKTFTLDSLPQKASFRITADDTYTLFINEKQIGSAENWSKVYAYDILPYLSSGKNIIAVKTKNLSGPCGWIGELRTNQKSFVVTDKSWKSSGNQKEPSPWTSIKFDDSQWNPAKEISHFTDSLWAKHPSGPPTFLPTFQDPSETALNLNADIHETTGSLAMRWNEQENVLKGLKPGIFKYDILGGKTTTGIYEFQVAPGTTGLEFSLRDGILPTKCILDGQEIPVTKTPLLFPSVAESGGTVLLEIPQKPGLYAGEMIPEPISFITKTGKTKLGDWTQTPGLECYSGGIIFRKKINVDKDFLTQKMTPIYLKADGINSSAEVRINGATAGIRIKSPWRWEITGLLKEGENTVEIEVYNTLSPHFLTIPTRFRGKTTSGILGNVRISTER